MSTMATGSTRSRSADRQARCRGPAASSASEESDEGAHRHHVAMGEMREAAGCRRSASRRWRPAHRSSRCTSAGISTLLMKKTSYPSALSLRGRDEGGGGRWRQKIGCSPWGRVGGVGHRRTFVSPPESSWRLRDRRSARRPVPVKRFWPCASTKPRDRRTPAPAARSARPSGCATPALLTRRRSSRRSRAHSAGDRPGRRLVEHQQPRLAHQRPAHRHHLALPARQLARRLPALFLEHREHARRLRRACRRNRRAG